MPRTSNAQDKISDEPDVVITLTDEQQRLLDEARPRLDYLQCHPMGSIPALAQQMTKREHYRFAGLVVGTRCMALSSAESDYKFDVVVPLISDGTGSIIVATNPPPDLPRGQVIVVEARLETHYVQPGSEWEMPAYRPRVLATISPDPEDAIDFTNAFGDSGGEGWVPQQSMVTAPTYRPPEYLTGSDGTSLIYRGMRHLISGAPEVGKTWIAAAAAAQLLQRRKAPVVWFDCDAVGQARVVERLVALGVSPDAITSRFWYVRTPATNYGDAGDAVEVMARRLCPALVVWDGWNAALALTGCGLDEAGVVVWRDTFLEPFHAQRPGCASLVTDHVARGSSPRDIYSYGAQGKLAQMDVHLRVLQRRDKMFTRARSGEIAISVMKDRPGGLDRDGFRMPVAPDKGAVTYDVVSGARMSADEREAQMMEAIVATIGAQGAMTTRQVEDAVDGRRGAIRDALTVLEERGTLTSEAGPRGAKVWRVEE